MKNIYCMLAFAALIGPLSGCTRDTASSSSDKPDNQQVAVAKDLLLNEEPEGAQEVITAREEVADGDEVVVVGRIGGSANPWIEGRAAFSIVDSSLQACSDIPGDNCPKPWDYCCVTDKLPTATSLVKLVDEQGQVLKVGAQELLPVQELSTVVVKGTAQRDDAGNLTVLARSLYVEPQ